MYVYKYKYIYTYVYIDFGLQERLEKKKRYKTLTFQGDPIHATRRHVGQGWRLHICEIGHYISLYNEDLTMIYVYV